MIDDTRTRSCSPGSMMMHEGRVSCRSRSHRGGKLQQSNVDWTTLSSAPGVGDADFPVPGRVGVRVRAKRRSPAHRLQLQSASSASLPWQLGQTHIVPWDGLRAVPEVRGREPATSMLSAQASQVDLVQGSEPAKQYHVCASRRRWAGDGSALSSGARVSTGCIAGYNHAATRPGRAWPASSAANRAFACQCA